MNENINNFLTAERGKLKKHADNLKLYYKLTNEQLETALKLYKTRHKMVMRPDSGAVRMAAEMQAAFTSDECLKAVVESFDDDLPGRLRYLEALRAHCWELEGLKDEESALVVLDEELQQVGIAKLTNEKPEYYLLDEDADNGNYIDTEWRPEPEKEKKCMKWWKDHGMI